MRLKRIIERLGFKHKYVTAKSTHYGCTDTGRVILAFRTDPVSKSFYYEIVHPKVDPPDVHGPFQLKDRKNVYIALLNRFKVDLPTDTNIYRKDVETLFTALEGVGLGVERSMYRTNGSVVGYSKTTDKFNNTYTNIGNPIVILTPCTGGYTVHIPDEDMSWGPYRIDEKNRLTFELRDFFLSKGYTTEPRK